LVGKPEGKTPPGRGRMIILLRFWGEYRWGTGWWMDLSNTNKHHSELPAITSSSLISTLYKSPQHQLSLFPACCVFISRSPAKASNSEDPSASRAQVISSQSPVQYSTINCQLINSQAGGHFTPTSCLLFTDWLAVTTHCQLTRVFKITPVHGPSRKHRFQ
jgi:hypothetical protein